MLFRGALIFFLCLCSMAAIGAEAGGEGLPVYGYHLKPPFIVDEKQGTGLYFDFVAYANRKLGAKRFRAAYMPRKRLEQMLADVQLRAAVIGVNPVWFHDEKETRFLWTGEFMADRDEVLSRPQQPVEYTGPDSVQGLLWGGVAGHYYFGVDEAVAAQRVRREDSGSDVQNLHRLSRGRIDFTIVSRSTYDYFLRHLADGESFHVSVRPHDVFARRLLVSRAAADAFPQLQTLVAGLPTDPEWQAIVARYR